MDVVADMLVTHLRRESSDQVAVSAIRPMFRRRATRLAGGATFSPAGSRFERGCFNADRLANRFWDYPRYLRARNFGCEVFHVVDHSYAQLVHVLPTNRTVVTCHDVEAFRLLVDPRERAKSRIHRLMAARMLSGFQRAAHVICVSEAVRDEVVAYDLFPAHGLSVIPNGVHPACTPEPQPDADLRAERLLGAAAPDVPELLHVGSTIPRKRIDVLLHVFRQVRDRVPQARLVRAGGAFTPAQAQLARELGLADSVHVLPRLDRATLAAVYRRAALVLQPSDAEGFGLPVAEAMACGAPVVASDLPVLHEVGGHAATFCPVGDVAAWATAVLGLLAERNHHPEGWDVRRADGIRAARRFSWRANAHRTLEVYRRVAGSA